MEGISLYRTYLGYISQVTTGNIFNGFVCLFISGKFDDFRKYSNKITSHFDFP